MNTIGPSKGVERSEPLTISEAPKESVKESDSMNREKILVSLKEKAAVLKNLQDNGIVAKVDVKDIENELNAVIEKLEGLNA